MGLYLHPMAVRQCLLALQLAVLVVMFIPPYVCASDVEDLSAEHGVMAFVDLAEDPVTAPAELIRSAEEDVGEGMGAKISTLKKAKAKAAKVKKAKKVAKKGKAKTTKASKKGKFKGKVTAKPSKKA